MQVAIPKILAVDDEPAVREMLRFILEQDGFLSEFAEDATQAISSIKKSRPDLILLDWMLPGMTGVGLGPTEFRLLHFFMAHQERVFSRGQLLDQVWGTNVYIEERTVDVHIRRLRMALKPVKKESLLQTVRGTGYRFSVN
jgi:DNA-binding response OmpR family regulator